jgi:hypothetical protein
MIFACCIPSFLVTVECQSGFRNLSSTTDNCVPMVCYLSGSIHSYAVLSAIVIHRSEVCHRQDTDGPQDADLDIPQAFALW